MNYLEILKQHYGNGEGTALYRIVMEEFYGLSQTDILLGKDTTLSPQDELKLQEIVARLLKNEPIQHILGYEYFCGNKFLVSPKTLIPRPETGMLVEKISEQVLTPASVLDIGTGTGCIAISLAQKGFQVTAMDISQDALEIARENAHRLDADICFLQQDILYPEATEQKWDVIVSNPPYICYQESASMDANVLDYEPHLALFVPDDDPLLFYRAIAEYGLSHLNQNGWLFFEINALYALETRILLESLGYRDIIITQDIYGKERFTSAHI